MSDETRTDEAVPAQRLVVDVTDLRGDTPDLTVPAGDLAVLARAIQAMPLPLVVWAVSPSGLADTVVVTANAASEAFTGLSHLELLGAQLDDLFDDDIAEVMYGHLRHAQRRGVIHSGDWSEQVFRPGSAIDRIWGPTVAKVDDVHVVLVLHDVSERIAHRRELRRKSQYDSLTGLLRRESGLAVRSSRWRTSTSTTSRTSTTPTGTTPAITCWRRPLAGFARRSAPRTP